jgi:hypothetical protein
MKFRLFTPFSPGTHCDLFLYTPPAARLIGAVVGRTGGAGAEQEEIL